MMQDQADVLRRLVQQRAGVDAAGGPAAPLVVVSGAKGGVGTTTLAANLAVALARQGRRAVFVDADLDHGGHTQLSPQPERASVIDVLAGRRNIHEALERGPAGIQVLSGAWASGEPTDFPEVVQQRFIDQLAQLAPHAEVVVVDAGSSRGQLARRLWHAASKVLVVATTEDAAVMQCYAAIKVLAADAPPAAIHPLMNQVLDVAAAAQVQARIDEACRRFLGFRAPAVPCVPVWRVPSDEAVLIFPPRGDAARAMDRVADTSWAQLQLAAARGAVARRAAVVT